MTFSDAIFFRMGKMSTIANASDFRNEIAPAFAGLDMRRRKLALSTTGQIGEPYQK